MARIEAHLRKQELYLMQTKAFVLSNSVQPESIDEQVQFKSLREAGFSSNLESVVEYRKIITSMSKENRKEIFWLKANDDMFHADRNKVGKSIVSEMKS